MQSANLVPLDLIAAFQDVLAALLPYQDSLNQSDTDRGKHGDEMLELFTVLATHNVCQPSPDSNFALVFDQAAQAAYRLPDNSSAQLYAHGLTHFANALRDLNLTLVDLIPYLQAVLSESAPETSVGRLAQGPFVKALLKGLAAWDSQVNPENQTSSRLSMGYLFDLGVTYMQARQHSSNKLEALVEAAVKHSPLKAPPYRSNSGKLVISTLLESILRQAGIASPPE